MDKQEIITTKNKAIKAGLISMAIAIMFSVIITLLGSNGIIFTLVLNGLIQQLIYWGLVL